MRGTPGRDTIVALSTAPGKGAIAVIRLSGPEALSVLKSIFVPRFPERSWEERKLELGWFAEADGQPFDEGMAVVMHGPRSFTGEDMAELYCHGGPGVVSSLLAAACDVGARPAAPGEFTRRAFLEGKIDLLQCESVADLVAAETARAARVALAHLEGGLSARLEGVWEKIVQVGAHLEAAIDFPEEFEPGAGPMPEGGPLGPQALGDRLAVVESELEEMERSYRSGRVLREGARVAILGRPNVGKSTLLNRLVGTERAIMSPFPGTTRDTVEEVVEMEGIPVRLIDTAGLRETGDPIELEGAIRARRAGESAELALILMDAAAGRDEGRWARAERDGLDCPCLLVANKMDLPGARLPEETFPQENIVGISALTGEGVSALRRAMALALAGEAGEAGPGGQAILTRERHRDLVSKCRVALGRARVGLESGISPELAAVHLNEAQMAVSALLGRDYGEALLDKIFETFCIGK